MKLSELIISDSCYREIALKVDPKNVDDIFQDAWLKIRELEIKSDLHTDYPKQYFYLTCKAIFIDKQRKASTRRHISIPYSDDIFCPSENYTETIYEQALDEVLSVDNEISNLIKLYLILPKLKEISKFTGIDYRTVKRLYKDARENIRIIADRITSDNDCNSYYYPSGKHTIQDQEDVKDSARRI